MEGTYSHNKKMDKWNQMKKTRERSPADIYGGRLVQKIQVYWGAWFQKKMLSLFWIKYTHRINMFSSVNNMIISLIFEWESSIIIKKDWHNQ